LKAVEVVSVRNIAVMVWCLAFVSQSLGFQRAASADRYAFQLVTGKIARTIVADDPCIATTAEETKFTPADPFVWLALSYSGATAGELGTVEWVQPSGEIYSSQMVRHNSGQTCLTAKIAVAGQSAAVMAGSWTVRLKWLENTVFERMFEIVRPKTDAVVILSGSVLPEATAGREYEYDLTASGGSPPYAWTIARGNLPAGLRLLSTGHVEGIPSSAGAFSFEVSVANLQGAVTTRTYALAVAPAKLVVSPKEITLAVAQGTPTTHTVAVSSSGTTLNITRTTSNAPWLTVTAPASATSGGAPITVRVNPGNMAVNTYMSSFTIFSGQNVATVAVKLIVQNRNSATDIARPIIDTFAGNAWKFPSAGRAKEAPINDNISLASERNGSLLVADRDNHVVLRLLPDGTYVTVAGTGLPGSSGDGDDATLAALNEPVSLAVDSTGNIYVAENGSSGRIRRITPDGIISTFAGTGGAARGGSANVSTANSALGAMTIDAADNLYVHVVTARAIRRITPSGVVTTVAGNGPDGRPIPGSRALETAIGGLAINPANDIFYTDSAANVIRRIQNGVISVYAGGGNNPNGPAHRLDTRLSGPVGIAFSKSGDLFVVESNADRIRIINTDERIIPFAGGRTGPAQDETAALDAALRQPTSIAVDEAGQVFFADSGNLVVRRVASTLITTLMGNGSFRHSPNGTVADFAYLYNPSAVVTDPQGNLYVAESGNHRVSVIASTGGIFRIAGSGAAGGDGDGGFADRAQLSNPLGLAYRDGFLYIVDLGNRSVRKINIGGRQIIQTAVGRPVTPPLTTPVGIAFDAQGNMYVSESTHRIARIAGETLTYISGSTESGSTGDNGPAINARLNRPSGLAFSDGNLYIADTGNHKIRRIVLSSGTMELVAGTGVAGSSDGPALSATLNGPSGLFVDAEKNIYFTEVGSSKVRRITPNGMITTVAGSTRGYDGDGGAAIAAKLNRPAGVVVHDGKVFIADTSNHAIRVVAQAAPVPTVEVSHRTLVFSEAANVLSATLELGSSQRQIPFATSVTTASGGNWLRVSPENGTANTTISVSVSGDDLPAGQYEGTISISVPNARPATTPISVTFTVIGKPTPKLTLQSKSPTFTFNEGASAATSYIVVANSSNKPLTVTASFSRASWVSVADETLQATLAQPAQFALTVNPTGLQPGTYTATAVLSGAFRVTLPDGSFRDESSITLPIRVVVARQKRILLLSQTGFTFQALAQGGAPLPDTLRILNVGTGEMNWTARTVTLSGGSRWLQVSDTEGKLARPYTDVKDLAIRIDQSGLVPGDYYGKVEVRAGGADNSPQIATVLLQVKTPNDTLPPEIRPTNLLFIGSPEFAPQSQRLWIGNPTGSELSFSASVSEAALFSYAPARDKLPARGRADILVQPAFEGVPAGVTKNKLNVSISGNSTVPVEVVTVIVPADSVRTSGIKAGGHDANCDVSKIDIVLAKPKIITAANVGRQVPIEAQVFDNCGNPVTDTSRLTMVMSFSNGEPQLPLSMLRPGVWTQSWNPQKSTPRQVLARVSAFYRGSNLNFVADQKEITFDVSGSDTPRINTKGIINGASFAEGAPLAPGMTVSIFGENLAALCRQFDGVPHPNELAGTEARLADKAAALNYVCSSQVNAQLPFDLPTDTEHQLLVRRGEALSFPEAFVIASAQPAVFTTERTGKGQANVLRVDGKLADLANPVKSGDEIAIYCTGLGAVHPPISAGVSVPDITYRTINAVDVEVDGRPASVNFSGLSAEYPGTYIVKAIVPDGVRGGDSVPLVLRVAGQTSPAVTIAVQ
jgi:uncharacterized protein (TIGR03437 family)